MSSIILFIPFYFGSIEDKVALKLHKIKKALANKEAIQTVKNEIKTLKAKYSLMKIS